MVKKLLIILCLALVSGCYQATPEKQQESYSLLLDRFNEGGGKLFVMECIKSIGGKCRAYEGYTITTKEGLEKHHNTYKDTFHYNYRHK